MLRHGRVPKFTSTDRASPQILFAFAPTLQSTQYLNLLNLYLLNFYLLNFYLYLLELSNVGSLPYCSCSEHERHEQQGRERSERQFFFYIFSSFWRVTAVLTLTVTTLSF